MNFFWNLFKKEKSNRPEAPQLSFKDRLSALRNLPRFFKLVWEANKWMTMGNAVLRTIKSATPLAILYVGKLKDEQGFVRTKS